MAASSSADAFSAPDPPAAATAPTFAEKEADFESMVSDLRGVFMDWLRRSEREMADARAELAAAKKAFEDEKAKVWKEFMKEKQAEYEKIQGERRKNEAEIAAAIKQVAVEREDARSKIAEERAKFEEEKEKSKRRLALDRERLRQEVETFEEEKERIKDQALASEEIVDLNVGGVTFETSKATLCKQPGSYLEALLSGREHVGRDRNGRIFIDRDSESFRTILNYLRGSSDAAVPLPSSAQESESLVKESNYYGVKFFPYPLVFAAGGHNGYEHLSAMEVLDVGNQCWRPCRSMRTERTYFAASTLSAKLYLMGGQNLEYKALNEMEVYDCLRDAWMAGPPLNFPRRNACSEQVDGKVYIMGGFDGSQILSHVESYDPRMKSWMENAGMTTPRSSAMSCVHGGKIFVLGGTSGKRLKTVEFFEPKMNRWSPFDVDMIDVRSAGQALTCLSQIYALGGTDNQQTIHYSVESLDQETVTWMYNKSMQVSRMDFAATVISDSIMVGGGQSGDILASTEYLLIILFTINDLPLLSLSLLQRVSSVFIFVSSSSSLVSLLISGKNKGRIKAGPSCYIEAVCFAK
ncbi:unnamed protein product [Amoebophrya sp. A120]|nr:unnamed protein product [Amoebophrya sp. A120]|eukprot:GSA120T00015062001.1